MPETKDQKALAEYMGGRTRKLGFAPVAEWTEVGEFFAGEYLGSRIVPAGPKVQRAFKSHQFRLAFAGCEFRQGEELVTVSAGMTVAASGGYLDAALDGLPVGQKVLVRYAGKEPKPAKGKNAGNILEVEIPDAVTA